MLKICSGDIVARSEEGGPIMLKVLGNHGDPVELAEHKAQELIDVLVKLLETVKLGK